MDKAFPDAEAITDAAAVVAVAVAVAVVVERDSLAVEVQVAVSADLAGLASPGSLACRALPVFQLFPAVADAAAVSSEAIAT